MTDQTPPVLSIEDWARRRRVEPRKAYRWVQQGRVATVDRTITVRGISADTPVPGKRKGK